MRTYVIGDLQGCLTSLQALLARLPDAERLIFVGDLVNRGSAIARVAALRAEARSTGSGRRGARQPRPAPAGRRRRHPAAARSDTLQPILDAPDRRDLIDWVRTLPLALFEGGTLFVHAGVPPSWTTDDTLERSLEVQRRLVVTTTKTSSQHMYGNEPDRWSDTLTGDDRLRFIVNALTRLRIVDADGRCTSSSRGGGGGATRNVRLVRSSGARDARYAIVFGHWSTEGLVQRANVIGIDTGCVWGGKLTAVCLDDGTLFQVDCPPT